MKGIIRNSGIDILGEIPWGTHFCQFYKTKEDLIDVLVPYFKSGLENNEFCIWVTSEPLSVEEAKESLEKEISNFNDYLEKGQIEIIPYSEWYVIEGNFDSDRVLDGWISKLNQALKDGYEGLRLTGNTFWLEKEDWNDFVDYEEAVDNVIGKYQMIAICTYSLDKCTAAEIIDVINNHEFALIKREGKWDIIENSEHKQTKEEAIQSKRNWEQTFNAVPDLITILDHEHRIIRVNKAMTAKLGLTPDECIGLLCYQAVHGTDEPPSFCPHSQLLKDELEHNAEVHEDNLGGDFIVSASPLYDSADKLMGSVHVARNITERKKAEETILWNQQRDKLLADVFSRLLSSENPQTIIDDLCQKTMEFLDCDVFFNYLVDEQKGCLHLNAYSGIPEEEAKKIEWLNYGVAVCGYAALESRRIIAENIFETPDPRTDLVKSYGVQAYACHPLIIEGQTIGTLSFGTNSRTEFTDEELEVMKTIAGHISIAMDRLISNHALKEAHDNLEEQVNERTSELKKQADLIDLTYEAIFVHNLNDEIVFWNKGAEELYGWDQKTALGKLSHELLKSKYPVPLDEIKSEVLKHNKWEGEIIHTKHDGNKIIVSSRWSQQKDENKQTIGFMEINNDITEIKEAEEAIKSASKYNRSLIEASIDPLVTIGPDGKITDVNKSTEEVTGFSRNELMGTDFSDYFTEPLKAKKGYQQVFQEGTVQDYPLEIMHKNGHVTPVLYNASVYRDESGEVIGVFAAARDITELKHAEAEKQKLLEQEQQLTEELKVSNEELQVTTEELQVTNEELGQQRDELISLNKVLKENEKLLELSNIYNRSLIEVSIDPLVTIGPNGKITDVNESTEDITGYSRDHLIGTDFSDYFTEPDRAREGYKLVFKEGKVTNYPLEIRHKNGKLTPVLYNASVYRDKNEKVIGVFAAARDITQIKKAEKELRLSYIYNRSLIEASLDPLVTIGPDGKITDVNNSTEIVTGCSRDELIGTDFSDYFTKPEKAREGYKQVFREGVVRDYPLEIRHRNGQIVPVLYNASLYKDESGEVMGVFAAARDITELKKAENLLKQKIDELGRSNAELEQFAYISSHDLQEPLRMIGSYLQLLERKYNDQLDDKANKYIYFAVDGATRMQNLIDDILTFSRVTTQAKEFELTDSQLILNKVLTNLSISIKENSAIVTYDTLPEVMVDDTQMTQLLQNLINNALKFRSKNNPKIHISASEKDKYWIFSVKDNGIGIDPKYSERIFEVFKRLHKKRDYPGTGIGLSICKKIVERHGGHIWVDSKLGEGSTFYFTIPVSDFDEEEYNET